MSKPTGNRGRARSSVPKSTSNSSIEDSTSQSENSEVSPTTPTRGRGITTPSVGSNLVVTPSIPRSEVSPTATTRATSVTTSSVKSDLVVTPSIPRSEMSPTETTRATSVTTSSIKSDLVVTPSIPHSVVSPTETTRGRGITTPTVKSDLDVTPSIPDLSPRTPSSVVSHTRPTRGRGRATSSVISGDTESTESLSSDISTPGRARGRSRGTQPPAVAQSTISSEESSSIIEPGRGRGQPPISEVGVGIGGVSPTGSSNSAGSPSGNDNGSSKQESPPQAALPAGRAAVRGKPTPACSSIESVVDPLTKLSLKQGAGAAGTEEEEEARSRLIESVPRTRPPSCAVKQGTTGQQITLCANFFEILSAPEWILHQYHVDFEPVVESKRMRMALMHIHDNLFPKNKAFDGSTLYSLTRLNDITECFSQRSSDNLQIKITIKHVAEIAPTSPNFVHLFNIVFRRCLALFEMTQIGRNFYDVRSAQSIDKYGLDVVDGFVTAIGNFESRLLLSADVSHRVINQRTVYDVMDELYAKDQRNFRDLCVNELVGQIIMTKYNNKTYKIDDIDWSTNAKAEFPRRKGGAISFQEYYQQTYQIRIQNLDQPLLISMPKQKDRRRGDTDKILLIPELCYLTGINDQMRADTTMMRELSASTKGTPQSRHDSLRKFVNNLNTNPKVASELSKWQMQFAPDLIELSGRVLEAEVLKFGNDKTAKPNDKADWTNDLKMAKHLVPINLKEWLIIYPSREHALAKQFYDTLCKVTNAMGIRVAEPDTAEIPDDRSDSYLAAARSRVTEGKTQLVVFVFPTNRKDKYDAVKKFCCIERAVPSQVILTKNLKDSRKVMGVMTKVAIQMNCKLGGEIWSVHIPMKSIMICGIDTYHDSAKKNQSVCAFVATFNENQTRFFSRATFQQTHQELSNNLTISMKSALDYYQQVNGKLPEKIFIYRDGVSDGQLPMVTDYEVPQIIKSFRLVKPEYDPKIACIVVKKRGNARFFMKYRRNEVCNPPFGTIIDNTVTREEWYDFYLISQTALQGTVNPTHYNIVADTTGLKPDHFQRLSYKLTHMYYNWSGTIRVPALCQYAHKLAFLCGQSLHKEHHMKLNDKLYYL